MQIDVNDDAKGITEIRTTEQRETRTEQYKSRPCELKSRFMHFSIDELSSTTRIDLGVRKMSGLRVLKALATAR